MSRHHRERDEAERFTALYDSAYIDVLRFLRRRSSDGAAEDLAHEVFLVAWRRFGELPDTRDECRAWLFGTARNLLMREWRDHGRRDELGVRIAEATRTQDPVDDTQLIGTRLDLAAAWQRLEPGHQEVLSLAIWEQLASSLAGQVLGISAQSYRVRLHRARASLRAHLDAPAGNRRAAPAPTASHSSNPSTNATEPRA